MTGVVEEIYIAKEGSAAMERLDKAHAAAGGPEGDR